MLPAIYDFAIYQGDTWERTIDLADSEGTPVPLDDWTIRAQIRQRPESPMILATFNVELVTGEVGQFKLTLPSTETAQLKPTVPGQEYVWDLELTDSLGRVGTYLRGSVTVIPQVTR